MWPNSLETADLLTFIEETLNGKLHFLCSDWKAVINESNNNTHDFRGLFLTVRF